VRGADVNKGDGRSDGVNVVEDDGGCVGPAVGDGCEG
jgi:hypothetical protein